MEVRLGFYNSINKYIGNRSCLKSNWLKVVLSHLLSGVQVSKMKLPLLIMQICINSHCTINCKKVIKFVCSTLCAVLFYFFLQKSEIWYIFILKIPIFVRILLVVAMWSCLKVRANIEVNLYLKNNIKEHSCEDPKPKGSDTYKKKSNFTIFWTLL